MALAELGRASKKLRRSRRDEFSKAYDEAKQFAAENPAAMVVVHGAGDYLRSVAAVLKQSGEDTLIWYNSSTELFNAIVL